MKTFTTSIKWCLLVVVSLTVPVACSNQGTDTTTTSSDVSTSLEASTTTTTVTTISSTTTMTRHDFADARSASAFLNSFDPESGDASILSAALDSTRATAMLPGFVENGSAAVREVVFSELAEPSGWNVMILSAMQEFGPPSGDYEHPAAWDSVIKFEISEALDRTARGAFGDDAEIMVDVTRRMIDFEVELCIEENCEWAGAWYALPQAIISTDGARTGDIWSGTVNIASDTGAGDQALIEARLFGDDWHLVDGYLAENPIIIVESPLDGSWHGDEPILVTGWALPETAVTLDGATAVAGPNGWFEISVQPGDGLHLLEVMGESDGEMTVGAEVIVRVAANAVREFAFVRSIGSADGTIQLVTDYAEWLTGDTARQAAVDRGLLQAGESLDNDFLIINDEAQLRAREVDPGALVSLVDASRMGPIESVTVPLTEFTRIMETGDDGAYLGAAGESAPYWLTMIDDRIVQIEQQYIP